MIAVMYARIAAAALCCLLALATSAAAESAWILWVVSSLHAVGNTKTEMPIYGFDTFAKCEAQRVKEEAKRIDNAPKLSAETAAADKLLFLVRLPDTVDPRGPKGTK